MSAKPTILFLGPAYPYRGGIASFTDRLSLEFVNEGHEVEVFTFSLQYPSFLFPGKTQFSSDAPPSKVKAIQIINTVNPLNWIRVGKKIRKINPDILIVRYWLPFMAPALGTILRIAKKDSATKVICIADNIIPHEKRPGDTILTSYFNKSIDGYVVMSEQVKKDLFQLDRNKPHVFLPHPLFENFGDPLDKMVARKELNILHSGGLVLFFGLIREYKGLDLLLEALSNPRVKELNLKLIVAGEWYEKKDKYLSLIQKFNLEDTVILKDSFIANSLIPAYMSAADVLVQPYRHATQSGVTPLAMHFNLPMIVTDVGGLKEMVLNEKTGLVVKATSEGIANGLVNYFKYGKDHFQINLPEFKKQFSWQSMYNGILHFYDTLNRLSS